MGIIADLHIHGPYAQATSKATTIPKLEEFAKIKGIDLLGTGDFTHPKWIQMIKDNLTDDGTGIMRTKSGFPFMLTTEISLIYTDKGKGRRVHLLVLAPNLDVVDRITKWLLTYGRVDYDGRPIFKITSRDFVYHLKSIDERIEVIPAHIWTPWFGVLGSKSGYDSMSDAFGDQLEHVHAYETGISSDPEMNWRVSELDRFNIVSFSDAHSFWPWRLGRESTIFDVKMGFDNILHAIRTGKGIASTVETDPGYGKYHYDGHRNCNVSLSPEETRKLGGICPKCGKPLTIGVLDRVLELSDREEGFRPKDAKDYSKLIPLSEIISSMTGNAVNTKKVWGIFNSLVNEFGSEFNVLLNASEASLNGFGEDLARAIIKNRAGLVTVIPGYDGEYGKPKFEGSIKSPQKGLDNFF